MRAGEPERRKQAFAIRRAVFIVEQQVEPDLEFDELDEASEHLLALADGRAVGTLRLRPIDDAAAKIERVAVLEDARGLGVGAALVQQALAQLREWGCKEVRLHAQTYALDFYAKLGFSAHGPVFDEDGLPHRAMLKHLNTDDGAASAPTDHPIVRAIEEGSG
ncbi:MAG: GNAT family N-acetyltransferase [Geminicoccaceae bacterium]